MRSATPFLVLSERHLKPTSSFVAVIDATLHPVLRVSPERHASCCRNLAGGCLLKPVMPFTGTLKN